MKRQISDLLWQIKFAYTNKEMLLVGLSLRGRALMRQPPPVVVERSALKFIRNNSHILVVVF